MFFGQQEIKLLHLAQPFSSKFHSISDGSNRYCCIQIHSCGMIFLLQFFFFFHPIITYITPPLPNILHGSSNFSGFFPFYFCSPPPPPPFIFSELQFQFNFFPEQLQRFHSFQNCIFSLISSPNSSFSFNYVSSIWHFLKYRGLIHFTLNFGSTDILSEKSYHSNGFVRNNIYLNHLKWNETLMKTVEPNVVA